MKLADKDFYDEYYGYDDEDGIYKDTFDAVYKVLGNKPYVLSEDDINENENLSDIAWDIFEFFDDTCTNKFYSDGIDLYKDKSGNFVKWVEDGYFIYFSKNNLSDDDLIRLANRKEEYRKVNCSCSKTKRVTESLSDWEEDNDKLADSWYDSYVSMNGGRMFHYDDFNYRACIGKLNRPYKYNGRRNVIIIELSDAYGNPYRSKVVSSVSDGIKILDKIDVSDIEGSLDKLGFDEADEVIEE